MSRARWAALALVAAASLAGCARGDTYASDPIVASFGRLDSSTATSRLLAEDPAVRTIAARVTALYPAAAANPTPARLATLTDLHDRLSDHTDKIAAIEAPAEVQHSLNRYVGALRDVAGDVRDLVVAGTEGLDTGTPRARLSDDLRELGPADAGVRTELGLPPS